MNNIVAIAIYLFIFLQSAAQTEKVDYSYPPLVMGSSWGNIFQRYYVNADWNTMIKLTSNESIKNYGSENIRRYYESMNFGYKMKLKSWTQDSIHYLLNYQTKINATTVIIRMTLTKGDTAKLVLPNGFQNQNIFLY